MNLDGILSILETVVCIILLAILLVQYIVKPIKKFKQSYVYIKSDCHTYEEKYQADIYVCLQDVYSNETLLRCITVKDGKMLENNLCAINKEFISGYSHEFIKIDNTTRKDKKIGI